MLWIESKRHLQSAFGLWQPVGRPVELRQPEMREEITSIQWLGFALTEAIVFYAFIFGLIAFFLGG